jgi:hypothetical protein
VFEDATSSATPISTCAAWLTKGESFLGVTAEAIHQTQPHRGDFDALAAPFPSTIGIPVTLLLDVIAQHVSDRKTRS